VHGKKVVIELRKKNCEMNAKIDQPDSSTSNAVSCNLLGLCGDVTGARLCARLFSVPSTLLHQTCCGSKTVKPAFIMVQKDRSITHTAVKRVKYWVQAGFQALLAAQAIHVVSYPSRCGGAYVHLGCGTISILHPDLRSTDRLLGYVLA
jgi:hypothetical protein